MTRLTGLKIRLPYPKQFGNNVSTKRGIFVFDTKLHPLVRFLFCRSMKSEVPS